MKMLLFAWRLLNKRIPIEDNLFRRGAALQTHRCARVIAGRMNQLIVFSLGVIFMVAFDIFFIDVGEFQRQSHLMLVSMLFNLVVLTLSIRIYLFGV
ncbi:hypothetical protein MtrunA17_Chr4g0061631 [Medicago truncatula]|nr:hypothetical protein MtrunA17_Chr4g0061631 [Medicago truncatula]